MGMGNLDSDHMVLAIPPARGRSGTACIGQQDELKSGCMGKLLFSLVSRLGFSYQDVVLQFQLSTFLFLLDCPSHRLAYCLMVLSDKCGETSESS